MISDRFGDVGAPMAIALSGGPDSAAAASLACDAQTTVRAIHVDHGLPNSPLMRRAATAIASELDLELEIVEVHPAGRTETALRESRYEALLSHVRPDEILVTGHNSDDHVETVLLNLLRGAGPRGLAGIPAGRGPIWRPFLDISAAELRAIADGRGLPFVDDPENLSSDHLRNRIRSELIPLLERSYNPEVRTTLARMSRHMADLAGLLESMASRVPLERSTFGVRAPLGRLAAVDRTVRRQVFRSMLAAVRPPTPPSEQEVHRVEATYSGEGPSEFSATGARCRIEGPWLVIGGEPLADDRTVALVDGTAWGDYTFRFETRPHRPVRLSRWQFTTNDRRLWVRGARPQDVIAIREGSKSVVDAIRERGHRPGTHPVVVGGDGEILWIPAIRHAWRSTPEPASAGSGYLVIDVDQEPQWAPFEP